MSKQNSIQKTKKNRIPPLGARGLLTVVGAGPGDPDLITLKAIKVLASANVVLYDALINESLLEYAPNGST